MVPLPPGKLHTRAFAHSKLVKLAYDAIPCFARPQDGPCRWGIDCARPWSFKVQSPLYMGYEVYKGYT